MKDKTSPFYNEEILMRAGRIVEQFTVDKKKATIRYPTRRDVDKLMKFVNALVKERVYIGTQKK